MTSVVDLICLVRGIYQVCQNVGTAKRTVQIAGEKLATILPVLELLQQDYCTTTSSRSTTTDNVRFTLSSLRQDLLHVQTIVEKAKRMSRLLYTVKAASIQQDLEASLKHLQLTLGALNVQQSHCIRLEMRQIYQRGWVEHESALVQNKQFFQSETTKETAATASTSTPDYAELKSIARRSSTPSSWACCSLTGKIMTDPVSVNAFCMHTFERYDIQKWISQGNRNCPRDNYPLHSNHVAPNIPLKEAIDEHFLLLNNNNNNNNNSVVVVSSNNKCKTTAVQQSSLGSSTHHQVTPIPNIQIPESMLDEGTKSSSSSTKKIPQHKYYYKSEAIQTHPIQFPATLFDNDNDNEEKKASLPEAKQVGLSTPTAALLVGVQQPEKKDHNNHKTYALEVKPTKAALMASGIHSKGVVGNITQHDKTSLSGNNKVANMPVVLPLDQYYRSRGATQVQPIRIPEESVILDTPTN